MENIHYVKNTVYGFYVHFVSHKTHKAQGSSIDRVFLDAENMKYCPDLQKMLYTALTRTKTRAFIPLS